MCAEKEFPPGGGGERPPAIPAFLTDVLGSVRNLTCMYGDDGGPDMLNSSDLFAAAAAAPPQRWHLAAAASVLPPAAFAPQ